MSIPSLFPSAAISAGSHLRVSTSQSPRNGQIARKANILEISPQSWLLAGIRQKVSNKLPCVVGAEGDSDAYAWAKGHGHRDCPARRGDGRRVPAHDGVEHRARRGGLLGGGVGRWCVRLRRCRVL